MLHGGLEFCVLELYVIAIEVTKSVLGLSVCVFSTVFPWQSVTFRGVALQMAATWLLIFLSHGVTTWKTV